MRLENVSNEPQKVWDVNDGGRSYEIAPGCVENLSDSICKLFLEDSECAKYVIPFKDVEIPNVEGAEMIWVANNTGNPEFPKTFVTQEYNRQSKTFVKVELPHPLSEAHMVFFNWSEGQKDVTDSDGKVYRHKNMRKKMIKLPPYHRRQLPMPVVYAWQNCLNFGPQEASASMILSRAPSPHEPNSTWDLDEIMLFGQEVKSGFVLQNGLKWSKDLPQQNKKPVPMEYDRMRQKALNAWYYVSINPSVRLPSREAWKSIVEEQKAMQLVQTHENLKQENKLLKKGS